MRARSDLNTRKAQRRSLLLTLALAGALVSVVGGAGLFAALSDTATTGTNTAQSPGLSGSADIQLATGTEPTGGSGQISCGTYSDDLETGLFDLANVPRGYQSPNFVYVCVKNIGSQSVSAHLDIDQLTDVDVSCSGDEAENGDATCGNDLQGELSGVLVSSVTEFQQCDLLGESPETAATLSEYATTPVSLGTIGPGAGQRCFGFKISYPGSTSSLDEQKAQSDKVTWRFRFNAQAS